MEIFHVGLAIKHIINSIVGFPQQLKDKTFPLVAPVGTTFPFITYRRTSGSLITDCKDGEEETVVVEMKLFTEKYNESIPIMHTLVNAFVHRWEHYVPEPTDPEMRDIMRMIDDINLTQSSEEFFDNTYIQTIYLEFTFK